MTAFNMTEKMQFNLSKYCAYTCLHMNIGAQNKNDNTEIRDNF